MKAGPNLIKKSRIESSELGALDPFRMELQSETINSIEILHSQNPIFSANYGQKRDIRRLDFSIFRIKKIETMASP